MTKVVFVLNHFLPTQTAGTEMYTLALAKYMKAEGINVIVVIPKKESKQSENYSYEGISVHCFAEPSTVDRKLILGLRKPEGLKNFSDLLETEKPDIVHFQELSGGNGIGLEHVKLAKLTGAKVFMTFHLVGYTCKTSTLIKCGVESCNGEIDEYICGKCYLSSKDMTWISGPVSLISNLLNQYGIDTRTYNNPIGTVLGTAKIIGKLRNDLFELVDLCDQVVCLTNWYKNILIKNGINTNKITVIEQGLIIDKVNIENNLQNTSNKPLKLMFLGRISKFKGIHLLIEALKYLPEIEFSLSIYGSSERGDDYGVKLMETSKNMKNIKWLGILHHSKIFEIMNNHDILCLCSTISEMSPLVIQEAKAAGIPVIASDVNGNVQLIKHNVDGLIFKSNNVKSLNDQLESLIKDRNLTSKLKSNIVKPKSFVSVGDEYKSLYTKTLNF